MLINTEQMISMSEANQNFSKVARMVDQTASDEDVREISRRLIARNHAAYEELAK